MSKQTKKRLSWGIVLVAVVFFIAFDIATTERSKWENSPITPLVTSATTNGRSVVTIATSEDPQLANPAPIDANNLTYEQVDAIVRRALDLDQSEKNIRKVIGSNDWVAIKVNMVTAPIVNNDGSKPSAFWDSGKEHWGQCTDLRAVKSVVNYLIEKVGPKKIDIVEGPAEWSRKGLRSLGAQYGNSYDTDGWELKWREFGNLSYVDMIKEFNDKQTVTKVDTTDLNDEPFRFEPVPGGGFQRTSPQWRSSGQFGYGVLVPFSGKLREGYYMPQTILDPDKVISMPPMKTNVGGITMVFKNYVGTISSRQYGDGTSKMQMDNNGYPQGFIDLASYNPPAYAIVEGFWSTEGRGPQWGKDVNRNVVIAGGDPLATECIAIEAMGMNPHDINHVYLAAAKGFGTMDLDKIDVVGRPVKDIVYHFQKHSGFVILGLQRWLVNGPLSGTDIQADLIGGEATMIPQKDQTSNGKTWRVWEHSPIYPEAFVDLRQGITEDVANTTTYAFTQIDSKEAQNASLWAGADDGVRIWLNGELVLDKDGPLSMTLWSFKVPVTLKQGPNSLMVKVKNRLGQTGFAATLADGYGNTLLNIRPSLPGEKPVAVAETQSVAKIPSKHQLLGNYPNPFNPSTQIRFNVAQSSRVSIVVYNLTGKRVRTLVDRNYSPGSHVIEWNGRDDRGRSVGSGVYLYTMTAGSFSQTKRMVLLK